MAKSKKVKSQKKKKKNSNKMFSVFSNMSMADKLSAQKKIAEISNSLSGDVKESFDSTVNDFFNGKDVINASTIKESIKELKEDGIDINENSINTVDDINDLCKEVNEIQNEEISSQSDEMVQEFSLRDFMCANSFQYITYNSCDEDSDDYNDVAVNEDYDINDVINKSNTFKF